MKRKGRRTVTCTIPATAHKANINRLTVEKNNGGVVHINDVKNLVKEGVVTCHSAEYLKLSIRLI